MLFIFATFMSDIIAQFSEFATVKFNKFKFHKSSSVLSIAYYRIVLTSAVN